MITKETIRAYLETSWLILRAFIQNSGWLALFGFLACALGKWSAEAWAWLFILPASIWIAANPGKFLNLILALWLVNQ
jgi:hypothetical protein